jgi:hypothetical protein
MENKRYSEADYPQVLQRVFDEASDSLNVNGQLKTIYKVAGASKTVTSSNANFDQINLVAHGLQGGDLIRFVTGANIGLDRIVKSIGLTADSFYLTQALPFDPTANTFDVYRSTSVTSNANGELTITVGESTETVKGSAYHDASLSNITMLAYTELITATAADITSIQLLDTTGSWFVFATGLAAAEVDLFNVGPGSDQKVPVVIPAGTRLSIKALDADATAGAFAINLFG